MLLNMLEIMVKKKKLKKYEDDERGTRTGYDRGRMERQ